MRNVIIKQAVLVLVSLILSAQIAQARRPVIITRSSIDLNGDGRKDRIAIKLVSGRFYRANDPADNSCPSCACGAPKFKGKFMLEVRLSGKKVVRQSLNALMGEFGELDFWAAPWQIVFDDYNGDGQIDFNLGQFASCSGWVYWLFTVKPDGHVEQLEVEKGNPNSEILAGDDNNSTRVIRRTRGGFYTKAYFNAAEPPGFYTSYYTWDAKKRLFIFGKDVHDRLQKKWSSTKPHWARAN